jgi:hypothetical protein
MGMDGEGHATPRPLYSTSNRPLYPLYWKLGGPRAGLDSRGKSRSHQGSIFGPCFSWRVAKPTELSRSKLFVHKKILRVSSNENLVNTGRQSLPQKTSSPVSHLRRGRMGLMSGQRKQIASRKSKDQKIQKDSSIQKPPLTPRYTVLSLNAFAITSKRFSKYILSYSLRPLNSAFSKEPSVHLYDSLCFTFLITVTDVTWHEGITSVGISNQVFSSGLFQILKTCSVSWCFFSSCLFL